MNVLIVYAHPEPGSFNGALKDAAVAALTAAGHAVQVSDLYAMQFDPVVRAEQFPDRANPAHFNLMREQRHAAETGRTAPDVAAEHAKLRRADLVIFQFPLWWGSMPAIMKGWVERVFSVGTVYGGGARGIAGKKALLSVTASGGDDRAESVRHVMGQLTHVTTNILALPQFDQLEPFFVFGPGQMTDGARAECLRAYQARLLAIAGAERPA